LAKTKFHPPKRITVAEQLYNLKHKFPETKGYIHGTMLIWNAVIKPTSLSREYLIQIQYDGVHRPVVLLRDEYIEGIDKPDFPHHFDLDIDKQTVQLCLHMYHEFNQSMMISEYIVPWTVEWLYYYEIWLATGKWRGGGHIPNIKK